MIFMFVASVNTIHTEEIFALIA